MKPRGGRRARGFTVIELIVVVALLGIVAALAAPSMQQLIATQRLRTVSADLVTDLTLARSEALKRSSLVKVARQGTGWTNGWTLTATTGNVTVGQRNALGSGMTLVVKQGASTVNEFDFDINGRLSGSGTVTLELTNSFNAKRCVRLDPSGRPKTLTSACT